MAEDNLKLYSFNTVTLQADPKVYYSRDVISRYPFFQRRKFPIPVLVYLIEREGADHFN